MKFSQPRPGVDKLEIDAGTTGAVRKLYRVDAKAFSLCEASTLHPIRLRQAEWFRHGTALIAQEFTPRDVLSCKGGVPLNPPPDFFSEAPADAAKLLLITGKKAKRTPFANLYDLHSALLYIRSQPLAKGDVIRLVIYQDNWTYFATVRVVDRESVTVPAGTFPCIKLDLTAQYINKKLQLETHDKFKHAYGWLSDDKSRLLIKAEADVFVGSIWAELEHVEYPAPTAITE